MSGCHAFGQALLGGSGLIPWRSTNQCLQTIWKKRPSLQWDQTTKQGKRQHGMASVALALKESFWGCVLSVHCHRKHILPAERFLREGCRALAPPPFPEIHVFHLHSVGLSYWPSLLLENSNRIFGEAPGDLLTAALHYVVVSGTQAELLVLLRASRTCRWTEIWSGGCSLYQSREKLPWCVLHPVLSSGAMGSWSDTASQVWPQPPTSRPSLSSPVQTTRWPLGSSIINPSGLISWRRFKRSA